ncbi:hypothetical protein E1264_27375, partial [Actinomadura sp. KC216]|uniref:hypothetical protein n=1 Tax=Actinomadura sp. KC216 TaxID=2530370 RepID=UPI00105240DA
MEPQGVELLHGDAPDSWGGGPDDLLAGDGLLLLIRGMAVCNAAHSAFPPSDLRLWEQTAARFVDLSARVMVLNATVRASGGAGDDVPVPGRLPLAGTRLGDIDRWCAVTEAAIPDGWRAFQGRTRARVLRRLTRRRPSPGIEILTAARALAGRRGTGTGLSDQQVRRRFEAMAPEAAAEGVQDALEIGARAIATTSRVAARAYADELISIVRTVNEETARRQAERRRAARYMLVLGATALERHSHGRDLAARLEQVLAGETGLGGDLQDACERLCGVLEADACADRLSDLLQRSLIERGFTIRVDRETAAPAILLSAFEKGTAARCGSLVIDDGRVVTAPPPRSSRRRSASATSAAFTDAVEHFRRRLGSAMTPGPVAYTH